MGSSLWTELRYQLILCGPLLRRQTRTNFSNFCGCILIAATGCQSKPIIGLYIRLWPTKALLCHRTQIELRIGNPTLGSTTEAFSGARHVLRHTITIGVIDAQIMHSLATAPRSSAFCKGAGLRQVLRNPIAIFKFSGQTVHRPRVATIGGTA